jgi:hypothetical protein
MAIRAATVTEWTASRMPILLGAGAGVNGVRHARMRRAYAPDTGLSACGRCETIRGALRSASTTLPRVHYLDFLAALHERLAPPAYLEIGIRHGDSLALARGPAVGIDPQFDLRTELRPDVALFRETSDEYFGRDDPLAPFGGEPVALAFIDGMHLAEFVVRDFANVERHSLWSSVVVFDDILPRTADEAARDRRTRAWTGDVYKALDVLAHHRPDLIRLRVGTEPTGLGVILGLDPLHNGLREHYDEIVGEAVFQDPVPELPESVTARAGALDPDAVLGSGLWELLRDARARDVSRRRGIHGLRRAVRRELGVSVPRPRLVDLASA